MGRRLLKEIKLLFGKIPKVLGRVAHPDLARASTSELTRATQQARGKKKQR
jgi:hypothetical protein